MFSLTKFMFL